jgi:hypothetical protein
MKNRVKNRKTRQVTQYSLLGEKLAVYQAIKLAAVATGISKNSIAGVVQGKLLKGGGYIWRYGNGPEAINLEDYWEKGRLIGAAKRQKKVTQYNLKGEVIATYNSITDASKAASTTISLISRCMNGRLYSTKGFIWKPGG